MPNGIAALRAFAWPAIVVAAVLVLLRIFAGWSFDGPFLPNSRDDFFVHGAQIKTIIEQGWYPVNNPLLGVPWGSEPHDVPLSDALSMLVFRLLAFFSQDWAVIAKAYFLLGFVLVALATYALLRELDSSPPWAAAGAVVATFLPFHFLRIPHLLLAFYVAVPLATWVALQTKRPDLWARASRRRAVLACLACLAVGSGGAYYAFFGVVFIAASGLFFAVSTRSAAPVRDAFLFCLLVSTSVALNLVPHWNYEREHGRNLVALPQRDLATTEASSLKLVQLILPTPNHRAAAMRDVQQRYSAAAPLVAENRSASLGLVGCAGLLALAIFALRVLGGAAGGGSPLAWLAFLAALALFLGSVGGLNSLMVMFVTPLLRGWNRISVFIGLFAAAAAVIAAEWAWRRALTRHPALAAGNLALLPAGAIALFAAWDQTPLLDHASYQRVAVQDRAYFATVQQQLPAGSLVFQLPYWPFPEGGRSAQWEDYSHMRSYLETRGIGWSYGGMKGREGDRWYRIVTLLPLPALTRFLAEHGFSAIQVDRRGLPDNGAHATGQLNLLLGPPAATSGDGALVLYRLQPTGPARADFDGLVGAQRTAALPPQRGACSIDTVRGAPPSGVLALNSGEIVEARGWVGDPKTGNPPTSATLYLFGEGGTNLALKAHIGLRRDDVARALGKPGLGDAGFVAVISTDAIPPGSYGMAIGFGDAAGEGACPTGHRVSVSPATPR